MAEYEDLLYEVKGRVGLVTLKRPDKLNAWMAAMEKGVKRALAAAVADDNVRVIVVTGAGRGFCAGADMGGLQKIDPANWDERELAKAAREETFDFASGLGPDVAPHYGGRFGYLMQVKKPIIAAINGPVAGIGLVFALYADMRFAGSDAKFTTSFAQRGLIAEHGISWLLPRLVGPAHALDLLLSARKVTADEAERFGLVNKVFEQANFMGSVMDYARTLSETVSPRSMAVMKAQVWKALFQDFDEALAVGDAEMIRSFTTADFKEGVAHFVEKRDEFHRTLKPGKMSTGWRRRGFMKRACLMGGLAAAMTIGAVGAAYAADPRIVCKEDYKRYCFGVSPQGGALAKCFERNLGNLSKLCLQSLVDAKQKHDDETDTAANGQTPPE